MPHYFASDLHLRPDHPERGRRLARLLDGLTPADTLTIVGDLLDFWMASRGRPGDERACPGLRALVTFRESGGSVRVLPGNHDAWSGPFFERVLGLEVLPGPTHDEELYGRRVHLAHGHLLGARSAWKGLMEGRGFLRAFSSLPNPVASGLEHLLDGTNARTRPAVDVRHVRVYREYARSLVGHADLVVLGHLHLTLDEPEPPPRLVVLGDWKRQSSYLVLDDAGVRFHVVPDPDPEPLSEIRP